MVNDTTKKVGSTTAVKRVVKGSNKNIAPRANSGVVDIVAKKEAKKEKKKIDDGRIYATGKRKNAIARVWLGEGDGKVTINSQSSVEYLKRAILGTIINQPFQITGTDGKFNVMCTVVGGGLSGQAGAIKHAISIALQKLNPDLRAVLKKAGFLTRDSRVVERKKSGLKKARKGQVYQRR
jgi:small subunit ribosomal protein S9